MAGRPESGDDLVESHDINVTPFIDVVLVLLIIFMVAAPLATVDAPVDPPSSNAWPQDRPDKAVHLCVRRGLALSLDGAPLSRKGRFPRRLIASPPATTGGACSCARTRRLCMAM